MTNLELFDILESAGDNATLNDFTWSSITSLCRQGLIEPTWGNSFTITDLGKDRFAELGAQLRGVLHD